MAQIIIPAREAISVLQANLKPVPALRSLDVTSQGPRLGLKFLPILPVTYIVIRFQRFEQPVALFELAGLPNNANINAFLKLPPGITANGSILSVNTDILIRNGLKLRGLRVRGVAWDGEAYHIETEAAR
jgi:hypothetical protein